MERQWILKGEGERVLELEVKPAGEGKPAEIVRPLLTVQEVCRRLKKSRRQVYRYLKAGRLRACARILGQWLFPKAEVERFLQGKIPVSLKPYFWDVRLSDLSADHHRDFILGRLLEDGDRQSLQWVFRTYSRDSILDFLRRRGTELLSRRSWHFWSFQLGEKPKIHPQESWRNRGRRWGGGG